MNSILRILFRPVFNVWTVVTCLSFGMAAAHNAIWFLGVIAAALINVLGTHVMEMSDDRST